LIHFVDLKSECFGEPPKTTRKQNNEATELMNLSPLIAIQLFSPPQFANRVIIIIDRQRLIGIGKYWKQEANKLKK